MRSKDTMYQRNAYKILAASQREGKEENKCKRRNSLYDTFPLFINQISNLKLPKIIFQ